MGMCEEESNMPSTLDFYYLCTEIRWSVGPGLLGDKRERGRSERERERERERDARESWWDGVGRLRVKVASRVQPHRRRNIRHCDRVEDYAGNCLRPRTFLSVLSHLSRRPVATSLFFLKFPEMTHDSSLLSSPSATDSFVIM